MNLQLLNILLAILDVSHYQKYQPWRHNTKIPNESPKWNSLLLDIFLQISHCYGNIKALVTYMYKHSSFLLCSREVYVDVDITCREERPRLLSGLLLSHPVKIHHQHLGKWTHTRRLSFQSFYLTVQEIHQSQDSMLISIANCYQ